MQNSANLLVLKMQDNIIYSERVDELYLDIEDRVNEILEQAEMNGILKYPVQNYDLIKYEVIN